jgi:alanine-glyoxylate transaminase/serine-glyoxylate transaminase/serine-pyruvate transaminase
VRKTLLSEFSLEIGAGLGPLKGKIWRFGLMGYSCRPDNVMLCLSALGSVLMDMGHPIKVGEAEAARTRRTPRCTPRMRSTRARRCDAVV